MNTKPIRHAGVTAIAALLAVSLVFPQEEAAETSAKLSDARDKLSKWVEAQQILSREREDWELGKDVLEQRIALVGGETEDLRGRIEELRQGIGDTDRRRREIEVDNASLRDASAALANGIEGLESKTRELVARLPDPIRDRVRPLSQKIRKDPGGSGQSLGQRFQNVVGVLNEVNKFNRDITVTSELRALPDGGTVEVTAVYVGLGQAYYVSRDGSAAGFGRPGPDGWDWVPSDDLGPAVARTIAILQNEEVPAFVPLPVELR